ncbi:MAG: FG-GAP-like repeat-containing protein [Planctomycetota bacterium]
MRNQLCIFLAILFSTNVARATIDDWVEFVEETSSRLVADPSRGSNDIAEKDYVLVDLDQDGDLDLVIVRKTEAGTACNGSLQCQNVLLMQEGIAEGHAINGVFVDRTNEYAMEANDGGNGFLDITGDRDVAAADVDNDGWMDVITASSISDGLPKTISHPRIYMNQGEVDGVWQGLVYEEERIPQLLTIPEGLAVAPRFCAVAAGDVNNDGMPDLYFGDYDGCASCPEQPAGHDLNDRLLINDGNGYFVDSGHSRIPNSMLGGGFVTSAVMADMNDDGALDIVRNPVGSITIAYNNPFNQGFFTNIDSPYNESGYHVSVGDLNQDGRLDLVASDDGNDRFLLNLGNGADTMANFSTHLFSGPDDLGGNSLVADLDNDTYMDVLITDFDSEFTGCSGRMHIYKNSGTLPNVVLDQTDGPSPWTPTGTHDVVVLDLNNDNWPDMFVGACNGHEVWINQPPVGMNFEYPQGIPGFMTPETSATFAVSIIPFGGGQIDPATATLNLETNNGGFVPVPLVPLGLNQYEAALPAGTCGDNYEFYISAEFVNNGGLFTDPVSAPDIAYSVSVAAGTEVALLDQIEGDVSSWTVVNDFSLTGGAWEQADPNGTISGVSLAAPDEDATPGVGNLMAFVTENGEPGGETAASDVDGGPTYLLSPQLDLEGTDAFISFDRWYFTSGGLADTMMVEVSATGGDPWLVVATIDSNESEWVSETFRVGEYMTPASTTQVRFSISDPTNDSITEGGVDNFLVDEFVCYLEVPIASGAGPRYLAVDASEVSGEVAVLVGGDPNDSDVNCIQGYLQADGTIGPEPVFQSAPAWGGLQYVTDNGILPGRNYQFQFDWGEAGNPLLGPPALATTHAWGDVDNNGVSNFGDVLFIVQGFQGNFDNVILAQVDLAPCTPNTVINFEDILRGVQAFQGASYAGTNCGVPCP